MSMTATLSLESRSSTPVKGIPRPTFNVEPKSFSTKKERSTPSFRPPPKPPSKTCPPVSRIFSNRPDFYRAQSITFLASPDGSLTGTPLLSDSHYDENKKLSYFEQAFEIKEKIGAGFFGTVYKVRSKQDGLEYAVKIAQESYRGRSDRARKLEEVRKHQFLLPHSNCVHFYQSWEEKGRLYQQFELCEKSLQEFADEDHDIPESQIWDYLVDLLLAVKHLHEHDLIHMDIKPENIFIGRDGICKLGDFGIVIDLAKNDSSNHAVEGDPKYLATEVLARNYSKAADIFSLGVTMLEVACDLDLPKQGALWHKLRNDGPDPSVTVRISSELKRIIQLMMIKDPNRRPTVESLLNLPSVKSALKRRRRKLMVIHTFSYLKSLLEPIWRFFKTFLMFLSLPFLILWRYILSTSWIYNYRHLETPSPMIRSYSKSQANGAFSSDEDEMDHSHLSSSTQSSLASPIQDDVEFYIDTPQKMEVSPHKPFKKTFFGRQTQSTPGNLRYRSRYLNQPNYESGLCSPKRLFADNSNDSTQPSFEVSTEIDDHLNSKFKVRPTVLAERFDALDDSDD
ncbi:membrane-associated tyrosine- and threonine-specific cdc2-inhibitory kinase [Lepeophtheirus salmonis]|uniref:non-specific serine/threonine protein kinase n=1 Tax=Lepeophtheirus salmonis TaxID=72036 RepID=A0A0K2V899_LEPSM|nr:membrane-associated tyrosine- and threonine-specific cdc2-inhibitory kinase-like [Lepeophtheirus salmonis]